MIELEARDVLNDSGTILDMRRKRATDMKSNRRVMMPAPGKPILEAEYNLRVSMWQREYEKYMTEECDDKGVQKQLNLTRSQAMVLKTLSRKVAKLEVIILEADKGKKFIAVDENTYLAMVNDHIMNDDILSEEEVRSSERIMSTMAKSLANIVGLGGMSQSSRNYSRCFDNVGSESADVPNLKLLPKVHKAPNPAGHHQSRPVVTAANGLSSRAGDLLSDILEPLVAVKLPRMEDVSTEEVLSQLEEASEAIWDSGATNTMVGSLDVRALYPSLDQVEASRAIAKFVMESPTEIAGIDYRQAQVFLACNMDEHKKKREKILHLLPTRLKKVGKQPGKTSDELKTKLPNLKNPKAKPAETLWKDTDPEKDLSKSEKRKLFSMVMMVAMRNVFKNHAYQFAGLYRRQRKGSPIGLRLTSLVARVVMDQWAEKFLVMVVDAGLTVHAMMKYVDDVNLVVAMLAMGTRWDKDKFTWKESWEIEDRKNQRTQEDVTIEAIREAADSVFGYLEFTSDIPGRHGSMMVPMLDVQVWVEHHGPENPGTPDKLGWTFYEKPSSSHRVLKASSAYSWRGKLVSLNMEIYRRMRNGCRQLTVEARTTVLEELIRKLRLSGYVQSTVDNMVVSGMTFYKRKLRADLEGGPRVNARKEDGVIMRRRSKMGAKETWFTRRRGGQDEAMKKDHGWRGQGEDLGTQGGACCQQPLAMLPPGGGVGHQRTQGPMVVHVASNHWAMLPPGGGVGHQRTQGPKVVHVASNHWAMQPPGDAVDLQETKDAGWCMLPATTGPCSHQEEPKATRGTQTQCGQQQQGGEEGHWIHLDSLSPLLHWIYTPEENPKDRR